MVQMVLQVLLVAAGQSGLSKTSGTNGTSGTTGNNGNAGNQVLSQELVVQMVQVQQEIMEMLVNQEQVLLQEPMVQTELQVMMETLVNQV